MDDMERDYEARPELDRYEMDGIDEDDQQELSMNERMNVDRRLDQEERMRQLGRRPGALIEEEFDEEDEVLHNQIRQERLRIMREGVVDQGAHDSQDEQNVLDFEDVRGPLFVWLKKQDVIRYVKRQFEQFIRHFKNEEGKYLYEMKIHEMCQNNKQSLEIIFNHLSTKYPTLAIWLAEEPKLMLDIINQVALDVVVEVYPDYHKIHSQIFVRVKDLPVEDKLRDLR